MLKPDETAEGRAVAIARRNNPAADQNAQSIVIHSLHRPGAPGIDPAGPPPSPVAESTASDAEMTATVDPTRRTANDARP